MTDQLLFELFLVVGCALLFSFLLYIGSKVQDFAIRKRREKSIRLQVSARLQDKPFECSGCGVDIGLEDCVAMTHDSEGKIVPVCSACLKERIRLKDLATQERQNRISRIK